METTHTLIVGAGPAGLASAACLSRLGIPYILLEGAAQVGTSWRNHYRRLRLHTARDHSSLPSTPFPASYPTYPSRQQVVDYLDGYARVHGIAPRLGEEALRLARRGGGWELTTSQGRYQAPTAILATGYNRRPQIPSWPGADGFGGRILHSADYRDGRPFKGKRVLVVGLGNTGGEIAIDLWEQGARPTLSVRGPIRVMPRDTLGVPAQVIALKGERLPLRVQDALGRLSSRLSFGDLSPFGLQTPELGPASQVRRLGRIPLIDVGTVELIKGGAIEVRPDVHAFTEGGVRFSDGREEGFDVVLLATGYRPALEELLEGAEAITDERGRPRVIAGRPALPGLYFVGFANPTTGFLRQIGLDAQAVAADIAAARGPAPLER